MRNIKTSFTFFQVVVIGQETLLTVWCEEIRAVKNDIASQKIAAFCRFQFWVVSITKTA